MTVAAAGPSPSVDTSSTAAPASNQRTADGDYTSAGPATSASKDSDGDYKPMSTAQTTSSASVLSTVSSLPAGG